MRLFQNHIFQCFHHSRHGMKAATAIGISANTRQNDAISACHAVGIRCEFDFSFHTALMGGALKGLGGRAKIAGTIVDNCNTHFQFSPR
ncbi:hypothetical protein FQZ97_1160770 [compost metagenome]